jgi:hypothetical protein
MDSFKTSNTTPKLDLLKILICTNLIKSFATCGKITNKVLMLESSENLQTIKTSGKIVYKSYLE